MLDVDGTTIPNAEKGLPSRKVKEAIEKANKKVFVGIATGRPLYVLHKIFDSLSLTAPCIINGGAQIIDPVTRKLIYEYTLKEGDLEKVAAIAKKYGRPFYVDCSDQQGLPYDASIFYNKPLGGVLHHLPKDIALKIEMELSKIKTLSAHRLASWEEGLMDITFTHANATKQHGILEVAKLLKIDTHEIIGVGDSANDFPLLMACGLRVAMGNAVPELKEIADYIAPTVDEDGVADVIEKYIL